jgi:hemerythrin-like domain-containing protein
LNQPKCLLANSPSERLQPGGHVAKINKYKHMKRHEAIAPLSRDHHGSLLLAQLLKKNAPVYRDMPDNEKDKAKYAQEQFEAHIKKHFEQEEAMLELVKNSHPEINTLAADIKTEHSELTALFYSLESATDLESTMDTLAIALETHIRKEERMLFPLLQQHCSEELLQEIHTLLH